MIGDYEHHGHYYGPTGDKGMFIYVDFGFVVGAAVALYHVRDRTALEEYEGSFNEKL